MTSPQDWHTCFISIASASIKKHHPTALSTNFRRAVGEMAGNGRVRNGKRDSIRSLARLRKSRAAPH
jgi:hypothetical protein